MTQYSFAQLEDLWIQGGGSRAVAPLMAAIAEAESSGNSDAQNPSGASGLWQILGNPFPGDAFDPLTNARMAVSKYKSQGLGAWETYTNGAYRQFLPSGYVPPAAPGASSASSASSGAGGLLGWPGQITTFFSDADSTLGQLSAVALALFQPSTYVRAAVGGLALIFLLAGLFALYKGATA